MLISVLNELWAFYMQLLKLYFTSLSLTVYQDSIIP